MGKILKKKGKKKNKNKMHAEQHFIMLCCKEQVNFNSSNILNSDFSTGQKKYYYLSTLDKHNTSKQVKFNNCGLVKMLAFIHKNMGLFVIQESSILIYENVMLILHNIY